MQQTTAQQANSRATALSSLPPWPLSNYIIFNSFKSFPRPVLPLSPPCRKKADEYLGHLVGHEGAGSLLSALKARGWGTELSAGVGDQSSVAWLFEVSITLTEAGLAAGRGEPGWGRGTQAA